MNRRHHAITLQQASMESPTLARLTAMTQESQARWKAVQSLVPASLQPLVQPGPIDGATWCLLVKSNAVAAKIRQLAPALQAHLRHRGWEVTVIRLKVQTGR